MWCRIKGLMDARDAATDATKLNEEIERIMTVLGRDYVQSNQSNYRKGGLIGLAAAALYALN